MAIEPITASKRVSNKMNGTTSVSIRRSREKTRMTCSSYLVKIMTYPNKHKINSVHPNNGFICEPFTIARELFKSWYLDESFGIRRTLP